MQQHELHLKFLASIYTYFRFYLTNSLLRVLFFLCITMQTNSCLQMDKHIVIQKAFHKN